MEVLVNGSLQVPRGWWAEQLLAFTPVTTSGYIDQNLYKVGLQLENKLLLTSEYEVPLTNWAAGQLVYQPTSRQNM